MGQNRVEAPWLHLLQAGILVGGEGETWDRVVGLTFGSSDDANWEKGMLDAIGVCEMAKEDVVSVLRSREDCER
jgi:hypothetical protein